jgi:hypothetical protein
MGSSSLSCSLGCGSDFEPVPAECVNGTWACPDPVPCVFTPDAASFVDAPLPSDDGGAEDATVGPTEGGSDGGQGDSS